MTYAKFLRVTQYDRDHVYSDVSYELSGEVLFIYEGNGRNREIIGIINGSYVVSFCLPNGEIPK
jgi:hypothetical protein